MVVALAACSLLFAIGITVLAVVEEDMPSLTGYAQSANSTMYLTFSNVYSGFSLSTVIPVICIVAVVVSLFVGSFVYFRKSGVLDVK